MPVWPHRCLSMLTSRSCLAVVVAAAAWTVVAACAAVSVLLALPHPATVTRAPATINANGACHFPEILSCPPTSGGRRR